MKNQKKGKQGITLIALVITIIVLLILAGVTIATLTGDNVLLQKAQTANETNEEAKEIELIKLAVSAAQVTGQGTLTTLNLNDELKLNFNVDKLDLEEKSGGWLLKRNKDYTIFENGNIEEGNLLPLLPKDYQQLKYIESAGTQYIDTGKADSFRFTGSFQLTKSDLSYYYLYGVEDTSSQSKFEQIFRWESTHFYIRESLESTAKDTYVNNTIKGGHIDINYIDNTWNVGEDRGNFNDFLFEYPHSNYNIFLFANNKNR